MKTLSQSASLTVSDLTEMNAANSAGLRDEIRASLLESQLELNLDLSATRFIDSSGLGALIALQKTMRARGGQLRLLRPSPVVLQILELTRLHRVLEIVPA
ncbi:MAG: STAS domain-containing protein [Verrucomicrobia bacterium]|nr:STAS domain-containing protein [Verrucomicrobiota bacterium]